jgi:hypothetical protein
MTIASAWKELWTKAEPEVKELTHDSWTGARFGIVLLFAGLLLWQNKGALAHDAVMLLFWLAIAYITSNTITRSIQLVMNGKLLRDRQALAWQDGVLTPLEASSLGTVTHTIGNTNGIVATTTTNGSDGSITVVK